jgi:hypothetical protein
VQATHSGDIILVVESFAICGKLTFVVFFTACLSLSLSLHPVSNRNVYSLCTPRYQQREMSTAAKKLWNDIVCTDPEKVNMTLAELEKNPNYAKLLRMNSKQLVAKQQRDIQEMEESQGLSDTEREKERKWREELNYRENRWFHHLHELKAEREVRLRRGVSEFYFLRALQFLEECDRCSLLFEMLIA